MAISQLPGHPSSWIVKFVFNKSLYPWKLRIIGMRKEKRKGGGKRRGRREGKREKEQETCADLQICCPLVAADRWSDNPAENSGATVMWGNPIPLLFCSDEIHARLPSSRIEITHLGRKGLVSKFRAAKQQRKMIKSGRRRLTQQAALGTPRRIKDK